jgi:hypothetical protein
VASLKPSAGASLLRNRITDGRRCEFSSPASRRQASMPPKTREAFEKGMRKAFWFLPPCVDFPPARIGDQGSPSPRRPRRSVLESGGGAPGTCPLVAPVGATAHTFWELRISKDACSPGFVSCRDFVDRPKLPGPAITDPSELLLVKEQRRQALWPGATPALRSHGQLWKIPNFIEDGGRRGFPVRGQSRWGDHTKRTGLFTRERGKASPRRIANRGKCNHRTPHFLKSVVDT